MGKEGEEVLLNKRLNTLENSMKKEEKSKKKNETEKERKKVNKRKLIFTLSIDFRVMCTKRKGRVG